MKKLSIYNPIRVSLMRGLHGIERQLDMDRQDIMLILLELDTEEKMAQFMEWCLAKMDGAEILAKPNEIVRAACEISDRLDSESDSAINAALTDKKISKYKQDEHPPVYYPKE